MIYLKKSVNEDWTEWTGLPGSTSEEAEGFESRSPSAGTRDGSQS